MKLVSTPSSVAILLCTYQGESYIEDQLTSFLEQTYPKRKLYISDDGSRDRTLNIIKKFSMRHKTRFDLFKGPKKGFASNFISLTKRHEVKSTYYAWADQDDIWNKTKLEKAIRWLDRQPTSRPLLFSSTTILVNHLNRYIQPAPLFKKPKTFQNALVQNIAGGNTMVFNEKARQLFIKATKYKNIPAHDWLMYQIVSACNGIIHYDEKPSIRYRQHSQNIIGINTGIKARIKRIKLIWHGQFRTWNNQNIYALDNIYQNMTLQNQIIFDRFKQLKNASLIKRFLLFKKSGIFRQTFLQNIGLILSVLLNKI